MSLCRNFLYKFYYEFRSYEHAVCVRIALLPQLLIKGMPR
jgi:hypothetical protein